jgi:hypothetical protein
MRRLRLFAIVGVATVCSAGVALATHVPQVDPATVPEGFLAAHNEVEGIRFSSIERAVEDGKADVFIQHARLDPNAATPWHTRPGPVFVEVVQGSLTYEDAEHGKCRRLKYKAGEGFFDRGGGHVHRAVAGAAGAHFYPVYVLPPGSETHVVPAESPEECTPGGGNDDPSDKSDDHDNHHHDHHDDDDDDRGGKSTDH